MNKENLLKALEPYSGAFLIHVIWGEIEAKEMNKYRTKIHRRITGKVEFEKLEIEKLIEFLKSQNQFLTDFISSL